MRKPAIKEQTSSNDTTFSPKESYYMNYEEISNAISKYDNYLQASAYFGFEVGNQVGNFLNSSVSELVGPVWDNVRSNLEEYNDLIDVSKNVNEMMNLVNRECLREILKFLEPDKDLNTADLPKFEEERDRLNKEIQAARDRIDSLKEVPAKISKEVTEIGADGKPYTYTKEVPNEPAYSDAQNEIVNIEHQINSELQPALNEANRLINKINEFNTVILRDIKDKLESVEEGINTFLSKVEGKETSENDKYLLATLGVGIMNFVFGAANSIGSAVDGIVWTLGGALCTIADNDEWRKDLADFIAKDFVGDLKDEVYSTDAVFSWLNEHSYYAYDSGVMMAVFNLGDTVTTYAIEAALPTPLAVVYGGLHDSGAKAEELYQNDPNALGGLGGDYGWRIAASGTAGAINGYLSNNAHEEFMNLKEYGFGKYTAGELGDIVGVTPYSGLGDFISSNAGDIFSETIFDTTSNMLDYYAEDGNLSLTDAASATGQALGEQFAAIGPGILPGVNGPKFAQIASPLIDAAQGTGLDQPFGNYFNNMISGNKTSNNSSAEPVILVDPVVSVGPVAK